MKFSRIGAWLLVVLPLFFSGFAKAQDAAAPVQMKFTTGSAFFADADTHYSVGGAADFRLNRRLRFTAEVLYLYESALDVDFTVTPGIVYDLRDPRKKVAPYFVAGLGLLGHRQRNIRSRTGFRWSYGYTAGAGIGMKLFLNNHWFVAPEARLGWEPFLRFTGSVGYSF